MYILKRSSLTSWLILCLLLALSIFAYNISNKRGDTIAAAQKLKQRPRAKSIPNSTSAVPKLEIVTTELVNDTLQVTIKNNTDKGVTAFRLSGSEFSTGFDGGVTNDPPGVVIRPYETTTISFVLSNLYEGEPLALSAALFDDGSEIGMKNMLDLMHHDRKAQREQHLTRRGGANQ